MYRRSLSYISIVVAVAALGLLAFAPRVHAQSLADYTTSPAHIVVGSANAFGGTVLTGHPAAEFLPTPFDAVADSVGNIYFLNASSGTEVDILYVADVGGAPPALLTFAFNNASTPFIPLAKGNVYRVAGEADLACSAGSTCGDGSFAVNAALGFSPGLAFDSKGNLYIADEVGLAIRKVNVADGKISTVVGDPMHANAGNSGDGGDASQALLTGPTQITFDAAGNLYIADNGGDVVRRVGTDNKISTIAGVPSSSPFTPCSDSTFNCGEGGPATSASLGGVYGVAIDSTNEIYISEPGLQAVRKIDAQGNIVTFAGTRGQACSSSSCGDGGAPTSALLNSPYGIVFDKNDNLVIADFGDDAIRGVQNGAIVTMAGFINQNPTFDPVGASSFDGKPAGQIPFSQPWKGTFDSAQNLIVLDQNSLIWKIDAPTPKLPQTIEFNALTPVVYGATPITLTAQSVDGSNRPTQLPITYTVSPANLASINGAVLTIKGAGQISITASQPGDATYSAATSVTQTLTVQPAPLTVKADDISFAFGSGSSLPKLTYHLVGLVNGDTATTAVTGEPVLKTTATAASPVGQYPITVTIGTLASANYQLMLQNGTLTITGVTAQTITFNPLANVTYGASAITLNATASSGLPVTYSVAGPASVLGSRLVVTGAGTVSVTATQLGNSTYSPATPVTQTLQVAPATLTITANNATREYNQPDPPFSFTATGFVNGDTAAVLSGVPVYLPPPANSLPGQYPLGLDPSGGTLFAKNYLFRFVAGTLTVTKASQTINFPQIPDTPYGTQGVLWNATASSGLPVTVAASGPIRYSNLAFDAIPANGVPSVGTVTVTVSQAGNNLYAAAAPVTQTFQVTKANLQVNANNVIRAFGADNPNFTYYFGGSSSVVIPANTYTGIPQLTTTADKNSPPGDYPIIVSQGTFVSPVFNLVFVNGTLTVLPKSSFTLTASPSSVTLSAGQSGSVKLTLTPINDFSGSVTIGCNNLPAGLNCVMNPQTLTPTTSGAVTGPASGVLTITATGASASIRKGEAGTEGPALAGLFWLPGAVGGLLILLCRKRIRKGLRSQRILALSALLLGLTGFIACGGSGKPKGSAQPGTQTIQVVGTGTAPDGSQVVNQLALTITVQ